MDIIKVNGEIGYLVENEGKSYFWKKSKRKPQYRISELPEITNYESPDLEEIKEFLEANFVWGRVQKVHEINQGEYIVFEYVDNHLKTMYHGFLNSKDLNRASETLDEAIIELMSKKHINNPNSQAAHFACKILGIKGS